MLQTITVSQLITTVKAATPLSWRFKACVNHTYYVRQADCLCSTNLQGFTAISKAQYGAQLDL